jgi:hypothetical protein
LDAGHLTFVEEVNALRQNSHEAKKRLTHTDFVSQDIRDIFPMQLRRKRSSMSFACHMVGTAPKTMFQSF